MTFGLASVVERADGAVQTVVVLPSGDRYRVSVEWLREESP